MKKLLLGLIIPVFVVSIILVSGVNANELDYEINLGNQLTNTTFDSNTYVEEIEDDSDKQWYITLPENFDKMAENDYLELYLEPETLAIAIKVKENGYVYSSYNFQDSFSGKNDAYINPMKSGVTLELYNGTTPLSISYLDKRAPIGGEEIAVATSNIQNLDNGFTANVDFNHPDINIRFDVTVTLDEDRLSVDIPANSISEYNKENWEVGQDNIMLRNIVVFPYFGSTIGENDGYVLVPDGSGALIGLDKTPDKKSSFKIDVYGEDLGYMSLTVDDRSFSQKEAERITIPLYGMIHDAGKTGFYVVANQGANYAQLNFKTTGVINDYYYTYFGFRFRQSYEQYRSRSEDGNTRSSFQDDINNYDISLDYTFLTGLEADYVGIAKSYQQDLLDAGVLSESTRKDYDSTPTKVDFIGTEIEEGILNNRLVTITSYNQMVNVIKQLQNDGYDELTTSLKTYKQGDEGYMFDVYRQLGGKRDFEDMLQFMEDNDIDFSYYLDYVRSYKEYSTGHAQTLSRREIYHIDLSYMFMNHRVNDTRLYTDYAKDDVEDLNKYGVDAVALAGLERGIYTSYNRGVIYSTRNMSEINEMLAYYNEQEKNVGVYLPDAYMYEFVDTYYDAPISSSDYSISIASVPFTQLVLGGYMDMYSPYLNFASDETMTLLRLVEYGVFPSYILTGETAYELKTTNSSQVYISEYDILRDRIATYYGRINKGLTATINKEMVDHQFLSEGVILVTYDDNTEIVVNYTDTPFAYGNVMVQAEGYEVID